MFLGILGWVLVGLLVGFLASKVVNLRGDDPRFGIGAAALGAVAAAACYRLVSGTRVSVWDGWGLMWAAAGALVVVLAWHLVRSRFISHASHVERRSY